MSLLSEKVVYPFLSINSDIVVYAPNLSILLDSTKKKKKIYVKRIDYF